MTCLYDFLQTCHGSLHCFQHRKADLESIQAGEPAGDEGVVLERGLPCHRLDDLSGLYEDIVGTEHGDNGVVKGLDGSKVIDDEFIHGAGGELPRLVLVIILGQAEDVALLQLLTVVVVVGENVYFVQLHGEKVLRSSASCPGGTC